MARSRHRWTHPTAIRRNAGATLGRRREALAVMALLGAVTACGGETPGATWQVTDATIPERMTVSFPEGGRVVAAIDGADFGVASMAYERDRESEVVSEIGAWIEASRPEAIRSESTVIAELQAVWEIRWTAEDLSVTIIECFDPLTSDFSLICVTAAEGSVNAYKLPR